MTTDQRMTSAPVAVIDLLNSLLEAELNSIFRFMGEGSPYLSRASADVRRPLGEMVLAGHRRAGEIADMIESLGVVPTPQAGIRSDEQYLAFLSLKFLLPKLVDEKRICIERYHNALEGVESLPQVPPGVPAMLRGHLLELQSELYALERAAAHISRSREVANNPPQPDGETEKDSDAAPAAG